MLSRPSSRLHRRRRKAVDKCARSRGGQSARDNMPLNEIQMAAAAARGALRSPVTMGYVGVATRWERCVGTAAFSA